MCWPWCSSEDVGGSGPRLEEGCESSTHGKMGEKAGEEHAGDWSRDRCEERAAVPWSTVESIQWSRDSVESKAAGCLTCWEMSVAFGVAVWDPAEPGPEWPEGQC